MYDCCRADESRARSLYVESCHTNVYVVFRLCAGDIKPSSVVEELPPLIIITDMARNVVFETRRWSVNEGSSEIGIQEGYESVVGARQITKGTENCRIFGFSSTCSVSMCYKNAKVNFWDRETVLYNHDRVSRRSRCPQNILIRRFDLPRLVSMVTPADAVDLLRISKVS